MKEERTAGPLHSAHSMQLHSPRNATCSPPSTFFLILLLFMLPTVSSGVCLPLSAEGSSALSGLCLSPAGPSEEQRSRVQPASSALSPHLSAPCLSSHSPLSATLACFVNNHLFVAGMAAAITSDLPVSSIMDRLLDVNICKSLLLDSPPGRD